MQCIWGFGEIYASWQICPTRRTKKSSVEYRTPPGRLHTSGGSTLEGATRTKTNVNWLVVYTMKRTFCVRNVDNVPRLVVGWPSYPGTTLCEEAASKLAKSPNCVEWWTGTRLDPLFSQPRPLWQYRYALACKLTKLFLVFGGYCCESS